MNAAWFPDNTVLCNFAAVKMLGLLEEVLNGRGRWVEAIEAEAKASASFIPEIAKVAEQGWLGPPVEFTDETDIAQIERLRRAALGGDHDKPLQHLGEAQTCHLLTSRDEYRESVWISDDREAVRFAQFRGIRTLETFDLMSEAVAYGTISRAEAFKTMHDMARAGRILRLPAQQSHL